MTVPAALDELGAQARCSARVLAISSSEQRNDALRFAADAIDQGSEQILLANRTDVDRMAATNGDATALDRLVLDSGRVRAMAAGLRQVAALPDPVGEVVAGWVRPNGLSVTKVRVPLGVVGIIYENRPNVTSDAAGLCLKSGNAVLLRGSSSAIDTNMVVASLVRAGLGKAGLPPGGVGLVGDTSRESAVAFMRLEGTIDCLIPRGGPSLIESIREHATVPYVLDGEGNCHIYVDANADLAMASSIVMNAKTSRPGVCNAMETLLVHRDVAEAFLPEVARLLPGVELRGDDLTRQVLPSAAIATEADFATEYLGLTMSVAVVDDIDGAIHHITRFGTGHSEAIITRDIATADRFVREVDAAAVVVNTSTRFVDGEQLGLGAEIGISTQKLHARGPMGLTELTCTKYVVRGNGQVRT